MAYQVYPQNHKAFVKRFPGYKNNSLNTTPGLNVSGSNWGEAHLQACRVVLSPHPILPILKNSLIVVKAASRTQLQQNIAPLSRVEVQQKPPEALRKDTGLFGAFFRHLATVLERPYIPITRNERPQRDIPAKKESVFTSGVGIGLSSPFTSSPSIAAAASSSPYSYSQDSDGVVERDEHEERSKHEVVTASMVTEFISCVLDGFSTDSLLGWRLVVNPAPSSYLIEGQRLNCRCQDDGSIIWHQEYENKRWASSDLPPICLIEAKACAKLFYEDTAEPEIGDSSLAQLTCELLGSMLRRLPQYETIRGRETFDSLEAWQREIFLITAHQTSVWFLHTTATLEYLKYIFDGEEEKELSLDISQSRRYDLSNQCDRVDAALVILAIAHLFMNDESGY